MPNVVFFSFKEDDRGVVLTIKGRAGFKGSDPEVSPQKGDQ